MKKKLENIYLAIVFIFLYAPIGTLMVLSFNDSKSRARWGGFTLRWYAEMFDSATIRAALSNTLSIAFLSALIATIIGVIACIGINSLRRGPRTAVMALNNIPLLNADMVTGLSLMLMYVFFGI